MNVPNESNRLFASNFTENVPSSQPMMGAYDPESELWVGDNGGINAVQCGKKKEYYSTFENAGAGGSDGPCSSYVYKTDC